MRTTTIICLCFIACFCDVNLFGQAVTHQDTQELVLALQSPDASARQIALENFAKKVKRALGPGTKPAPTEAVAAINEAMPLLSKALVDANDEVRRASLVPLGYIAINQQAARRGVDHARPDLTSDPSVSKNLIKLMSAPDGDRVRAPATWIYAWSFRPTPELEQKWMSNFAVAEGNERLA